MAVENTILGIDGIVKAFYNCVRTRTHILIYIDGRGFSMTDNEKELINLIRESCDPEAVASYMLSLFLDYLRTNAPSQEGVSAVLQGSA